MAGARPNHQPAHRGSGAQTGRDVFPSEGLAQLSRSFHEFDVAVALTHPKLPVRLLPGSLGVCLYITTVPITKLFAWGGGGSVGIVENREDIAIMAIP
jgi:hypothetical protein